MRIKINIRIRIKIHQKPLTTGVESCIIKIVKIRILIRIETEEKTMARPKSTTPTKGRLNLTVTEQTRQELAFIAAHNGQSVSELVAEWASKEAAKIAKKTGKNPPDCDQLTML
jgi:hypothetical protein